VATRKRIIFVEDDTALQRIMIKWLAGYEVRAFDNADEAYEHAVAQEHAGTPADLFLLDIMLKEPPPQARRTWAYHQDPIGHGIRLGRHLRRVDAYENTPIVFLSAKLKTVEDRDKLSDHVQAICFPKPTPYKQLQDQISQILGNPDKNYWQKLAAFVCSD